MAQVWFFGLLLLLPLLLLPLPRGPRPLIHATLGVVLLALPSCCLSSTLALLLQLQLPALVVALLPSRLLLTLLLLLLGQALLLMARMSSGQRRAWVIQPFPLPAPVLRLLGPALLLRRLPHHPRLLGPAQRLLLPPPALLNAAPPLFLLLALPPQEVIAPAALLILLPADLCCLSGLPAALLLKLKLHLTPAFCLQLLLTSVCCLGCQPLTLLLLTFLPFLLFITLPRVSELLHYV
mmetsp:Transcript_115577/g.351509  ORF Transcript_115577/g.351509 Transcript_115577/m.351509 type:complete len:237 (-) Transcript_115577:213-923(-)